MMGQLPENNTGSGDTPTALPAASLGRVLREARERLGLSVADVSGQTKLAPRQIEALEADDLQRLPEMAFVRGFVRSYAKILQLDAQPLLAFLPQVDTEQVLLEPASVEAPFPSAHSPQRQNLIWLGAALLLAVLMVTFAVWHFTTPLAQPEAAQVEAPVSLPDKMQVISVSPVAETGVLEPPAAKVILPPTAAAQSPAPIAKPAVSQDVPHVQPVNPVVKSDTSLQTATLRLAFDEESWAEIRDKDDKILSSQVNPRGSELQLDGRAPFSLVIGHAASARIHYKGKQVDLTPYINSSSEVARLTLE